MTDLVMEVVSEDDPERDYVKKREDYARGGVAEYWIVDPQRQEIAVLNLAGKRYETHGVFRPGEEASSRLLDGFSVPVKSVFDAGNV